MELSDFFPFWNKLSVAQQDKLTEMAQPMSVKAGTVVHNGSMDCLGLLLIQSGQLRVYTLSEEGREVTLYRLFELDICLFSASCVMPSVQFEVVIEGYTADRDPLLPFQESDGGFRPGGQLHQPPDQQPFFRGHVAHGADHVEEL